MMVVGDVSRTKKQQNPTVESIQQGRSFALYDLSIYATLILISQISRVYMSKMVKVGNYLEMAQSERNSHNHTYL